MASEVLDEIKFDNTPYGGSDTYTYDSDFTEGSDYGDDTDTLDVDSGLTIRRGARKTYEVTVHRSAAFTELVGMMETNTNLDVTLTRLGSGETDVLSECRMIARPIMDQVADIARVWIDDAGVADNPDTDSDSSWVDLEAPVGGAQEADITINTNPSGVDTTRYVSAKLDHDIELEVGNAYSELKTRQDNGTRSRVAIEHPDGTFRLYDDVRVFVSHMPHPQPDQEETVMMYIRSPAKDSITDILTFPTGAADYFYGAQATVETFAHDEADILTLNRP